MDSYVYVFITLISEPTSVVLSRQWVPSGRSECRHISTHTSVHISINSPVSLYKLEKFPIIISQLYISPKLLFPSYRYQFNTANFVRIADRIILICVKLHIGGMAMWDTNDMSPDLPQQSLVHWNLKCIKSNQRLCHSLLHSKILVHTCRALPYEKTPCLFAWACKSK